MSKGSDDLPIVQYLNKVKPCLTNLTKKNT